MSLLKLGNNAFRNKDYHEALKYYLKANFLLPELSKTLQFNINQTEKKLCENFNMPFLEPIKKLPLTVLVIAWDVGHNPLGRAYMLADALTKSVRNVVLAGFQFPRYGDDTWEPVRQGSLPIISLPGNNFPEFIASCEKAVQKFRPDIVIACKPRLPSVQLGIMFKYKYKIPLIIDIDDHELSFFKNATPLSIKEVINNTSKEIRKEAEPYGETWTRLTQSLTKQYADEILVSNVALQREFNGKLVPHVRDEITFNPQLFNKNDQRNKYNIPLSAKVVMFFGTPRQHKGVNLLAEAVGQITNDKVILVVVGSAPDKSVTAQLSKLSKGKIICLPNQPFSAIPEIIITADLVCLPQDEGHAISKYQLPAKAIDAIGMGIPLLVSNTTPLMQLVNDKVAKLIPQGSLTNIIERQLSQSKNTLESLELRKKFLLDYSYHSAALKLKSVIEKVQNKALVPITGFEQLVSFQKGIISDTALPIKIKENKGIDIVIFWKQNDTGLYGRRSDMVIKYLASRKDIRKVVVFDAPISVFDLTKMQMSGPLLQQRNIFIKVYEKLLGKLDSDKISYNVFAHPAGVFTYKGNELGRVPIFDGYSQYIKKVLEQEDVIASNSIFWFYPKNYQSDLILDYFKPRKVVVDVVDDHRSWPGVSVTEKQKLTEHYENILASADLALANCQPVVDSMKKFKQDIQLIPNGCELNPRIDEPKNNTMYNELKSFRGKVIGFVGNLEAKIDLVLIGKIAAMFPNALIVLIGSTHANSKARDLQSHANIRMFGVVNYKYVNAVVSRFNVGIVPHLKMDMTENMNPLKVFVYLSNRIPVVTTKISNLPITKTVIISDGHASFIKNINNLLNEKLCFNICDFDKILNEVNWDSRLSCVVDKLLS